MKCKICGTSLKEDLFSFVTQEPVCSICKIQHVGGLPTTTEAIQSARLRLGLAAGEYLQQDNEKEAKNIINGGRLDALGRRQIIVRPATTAPGDDSHTHETSPENPPTCGHDEPHCGSCGKCVNCCVETCPQCRLRFADHTPTQQAACDATLGPEEGNPDDQCPS